LPPIPQIPPQFTPGTRLTQERYDALDLDPAKFLLPAEIDLLAHVLKANEEALAWDESMKGAFKASYFDPVTIPVVEHVPWAHRNMPIPPGVLDEVMRIIRDKIQTGIYEPS
ncbi:hypothetical protein SISSUDRAFT_964021, partial [Sistotremastrum suecicum HHB10207 ss-3]